MARPPWWSRLRPGQWSTARPPDPGDLFTSPVTEPPAIENPVAKIQRAIGQGAAPFGAERGPNSGLSHPRLHRLQQEQAIDDEASFGVTSWRRWIPPSNRCWR